MGGVRYGHLLLVGLAAAALTGCAAGAAPPAAPAATPAATPTRADPVTACTNQLVYWVGAQLRGEDDGGDYQHHGLTSEQDDAVQTIVAEAKDKGAALPPDQITRQAHSACERIVASPSWGSGF
jgi:Spy/CpxP family protein refolding chaperone